MKSSAKCGRERSGCKGGLQHAPRDLQGESDALVVLCELPESSSLSSGRARGREERPEEAVCEQHLEARVRFRQVLNWGNRTWSWEEILRMGIGICKVIWA